MAKTEKSSKKRKKGESKKNKAPVLIGLDTDGNPPDFPYVRTKRSSIHNNGLFAANDIPKDEYVIQYLGERISKKESTRRGVSQHDKALGSESVGSVYIFELNEKHDIDGNFEWNIARLANHSCNPNCEAQNVDGEIWLVALKNIRKNDELTFDYGYALEHWEDHPCRCGSSKCIGYIVRKEDRKRLRKILEKQRKRDHVSA